MSEQDRVELYTERSVLAPDGKITIRVGKEVATLLVSEWTRMLARPSRMPPPLTTA